MLEACNFEFYTENSVLRHPDFTKQELCSYVSAVVAFFLPFPGMPVALTEGSAGRSDLSRSFLFGKSEMVLDQ